ncbi:MAG: hypothetical protein U0163_16040 [Gemmatimonadaceae bacterium]
MITFHYYFPFDITAGTVTQLASGRPINATTGVDNNGDGSNNDRPVIDGQVVGKSLFRGPGTRTCRCSSRNASRRTRHPAAGRRVQRVQPHEHPRPRADGDGDTGTATVTFGQLAAVGTASTAPPSLANIDPPRMFQLQLRFQF